MEISILARSKVDGLFFPSKERVKKGANPTLDKPIKYVLFDVFGTVVDVRGTMINEFTAVFAQKGFQHLSCDEFIEAWINAYSENMRAICEGARAFATVDELNLIALNKVLMQFQIDDQFTGAERENLWLIWHRLTPWPDSVSGLQHLNEQFKIGTLSNGNMHLLEDLSKNAGIEWDRLLSGEVFQCYKPNPLVYQCAAQELKLHPSELLLVASHKYDLEAARQCGFKTAYIFRPSEFKTLREEQIPIENEFDFVAEGIDVLAKQLSENNLASISFSL